MRLTPNDRLTLNHLARTLDLNRDQGGIYLLVCEPDKQASLRTALQETLEDWGWQDEPLPEDGDILRRIALEPHPSTERPTIRSVAALDLDDAAFARLARALNIRREYVPDKALHLVLWLEPGRVADLVRLAKDFWSFRTEVARFDPPDRDRGGESPGLEAIRKQIAETEELLADAGDDDSLRASLLFQLGNLRVRSSDLSPSLEAFTAAAELYRQLEDDRNLGAVLGNIGLIHNARGDLDAALAAHEQALEIDRAIGFRQGVASDLGDIGLIHQARGDLDAALAAHEQALEIHRAIGFRQGVASDLGNIGLIHKARGDLDAALAALEQAQEIYQAIGYGSGASIVDRAISEIRAQRAEACQDEPG